LISTALSSPRELEAFRDETIGPALAHDDRLGADLLATFAAYLRHGCNMNATAHALHAHRHTVAYRLGRLNELTGLDPHDSEDRERLGVALKAARILDALRGD
jgi:DNA-binding PucR family transcriptional regulator